MTVQLDLTEQDSVLIRDFAEAKQKTIAELFYNALMEQIEDALDLQAYEEAMAEFRANPITYTQEEIERELGML
jgi:predicted ATPase